VKNEAQHLKNLLESISKIIALDIEIVVVLNGCTDSSASIANHYDTRIIEVGNALYPSKARNLGYLNACGNIIVFLDADVVITEEWGCKLREFHQKHTEFVITGSPYEISTKPSWIEINWFKPLMETTKNYINGGNIITTRKVMEMTEGFDESLETGEDVDFSRRARKLGIDIVIDKSWKVHHEGFPKSVREFVKREAWHGKGDFISLENFVSSKVALATVCFLSFIVLSIISILFENYILLISSLIGVFIICLLRALAVIKYCNITKFFSILSISFLYFYGRSLSIVKAVINR
jgi:GT2 family glycosyltransferase